MLLAFFFPSNVEYFNTRIFSFCRLEEHESQSCIMMIHERTDVKLFCLLITFMANSLSCLNIAFDH